MGVKGLTSFVNSNDKWLLPSCDLHDCYIIVDGNALNAHIFLKNMLNTTSFGGDYDRFSNHVQDFFNQLSKSNIFPIVIFDGGVEKRKMKTLLNRMKDRIRVMRCISPGRYNITCFPLMLRLAFRMKLVELGITFFQADFEADDDIAALAKLLNCPVLSNDSDFFISGADYLPLTNFSLYASRLNSGNGYCIRCKVFSVKRFYNKFGLNEETLPLLALLLGNDYIKPSVFSKFFEQMKLPLQGKRKDLGKKASRIINWLKNESYDSATAKIFGHLKKEDVRKGKLWVKRAIAGYVKKSCTLDAYVLAKISKINFKHSPEVYDKVSDDQPEDFENDNTIEIKDYELVDDEEKNEYSFNENCDEIINEHMDGTNNESEEENLNSFTTNEGEKRILQKIPEWFLDRSRKGYMAASITGLLTMRLFFNDPQIEEYDFEAAGHITIPTVCKIAGIVLGPSIFSYYSRHKDNLHTYKLESDISSDLLNTLPRLHNIDKYNEKERCSLFYEILHISYNDNSLFPESWQVFTSSLFYWLKESKQNFKDIYLHSIVVMLIAVNIVTYKIGYFRNAASFNKRYASRIKRLSPKKINEHDLNNIKADTSIEQLIESVPVDECINIFRKFLPFFHNYHFYSSKQTKFFQYHLHSFSEFQSCLSISEVLNSLLIHPLKYLNISKFYNGTFLYNWVCQMQNKVNFEYNMSQFFHGCPFLYVLYNKMYQVFDDSMDISKERTTVRKRKKNKTKNRKNLSEAKATEITEDDSGNQFWDEGNKFSLLNIHDGTS